MAAPMTALIVLPILVAAATWLTLRLAAVSELDVLPARCWRRLMWWQRNHNHVYLLCGAVALAAVLADLLST